MAAVIYNPTSGALARTPILCKIEDSASGVDYYTLDVRVWQGNSASIPTTASYFLEKYPDENNAAVFDISQLLQSELKNIKYKGHTDFSKDPTQAVWVECTYGESVSGSLLTPIVGNVFSVVGGYGEFIQGANPTVETIAGSQKKELLLIEGGYYALPICQAATGVGSLSITFDISAPPLVITNTNVAGNLTENVMLYTDISPSRFAGSYNKQYSVSILDTVGNELDEIIVTVECEPRYQTATIAFVNKNGAWDYLTFSKARKESINVENAEYMPHVLDTTFGQPPTYETSKPQIKKYDINAQESVTLNTTFLPESYYETIKQIMMSNRCVWIEKDLSVNPKTMNMQKKISVNKEMIQYTIEFDFASLTQSTVR